jgi:hypothetical protein
MVVPHESLHDRQVHARLGQCGSETVTKGMRVTGGDASLLPVIAKDAAQPLG